LIAVQCKRQLAAVPIGVVRQLNGTLAHEHAGRAGMLVTTAYLTKPAADLAARTGITVVDRNALARWMGQARRSIERNGQLASNVAPSGPPRPAPWPQP
jgi:HJR/Mrr/RecB family endonuclease